jgi:hypothetical protein
MGFCVGDFPSPITHRGPVSAENFVRTDNWRVVLQLDDPRADHVVDVELAPRVAIVWYPT